MSMLVNNRNGPDLLCGECRAAGGLGRLAQSLEHLQGAQDLLNAACRCLCPVNGIENLWAETCALSDLIKAHWHKVEAARIALRSKIQNPDSKIAEGDS